MATIGGVFFSYQSVSRLVTYHNRTYDLALYSRQAWGLARLDGWNPIVDQSFFTSHWSIILLPLGLLGRLCGTVYALLIFQSVALAATALPLARFAQRRGGPVWGAAAAAVFLLYPNTAHVASYEFHPGNLAVPALAYALDAVDRRDTRTLGLSALWTLSCRADLSLALAALALVAYWLEPSLRRASLRLGVASLGYFSFVMLVRALAVEPTAITSADLHFGVWGGSPLGFLLAPFTHFDAWLAHVGSVDRLTYPLRVLAPCLLLPLLRPRYLLVAAPFLAINLISAFPTTIRLYSHYLTPAVPALVCATFDGLAAIGSRRQVLVLPSLLVSVAVGSAVAGGAPWSLDFVRSDYLFDHTSWRYAWLHRAVPDDVSVQAPDALLPHLAERAVVHRAPPPERGTEFVVLDVRHRLRFIGDESLLRTIEEPHVRAWLARDDYAVVAASPVGLVLQRSDSPRASFSKRFFTRPRSAPTVPLTDCLSIHSGALQGTRLTLILRAHAACPSDLALRIGSGPRPSHVRLPFDGHFSPAHLRAGDWITSAFPLPGSLAERVRKRGLRVGVLRASGARPFPRDPVSVSVTMRMSPLP
ncbi:MAG: DUF2079 domain-containing protein [Myxococcales bacterium]|nr:DUF2079 domain-containing protein [Myxococcales bacterium]